MSFVDMICELSLFLWSQSIVFFVVAIIILYKWSTATFNFYAKKNIEYAKPYPLLGSFPRMILQLEPGFDTFKELYLKFRNRKFVGFYELRNPILMITSPDIIKQVAIKDFDHFMNHRSILDTEDEPLFANSLFALQNQKWKDMRATLSPAFTGSKMRLMFQLVEECSCTAIQYLESLFKDNDRVEVDMKDFFAHFTIDVIASCAFGLQIKSHSEKDNEFYQMARRANNFSKWVIMKIFLFANFSRFMKLFKITLFDVQFRNYFSNVVLSTMRNRAQHGTVRPDMIHLLMEAQKGTLRSSDIGQKDSHDGFATAQELSTNTTGTTYNWTDTELVAQCFLFFLAGLETGSNVLCFCAHELMENPDIQARLIEEIDQVQSKLDGSPLTYEVLQKMKYLDMVISETLRKWPPGVGSDRVCTKQCLVGDKDGEHVLLAPGDIIIIPTSGLHRDPDYWPEPNKFDPERFSDENKTKIKPFTYIPFGVGPRNCIGSRLALMKLKAILFHLLSNFTLVPSAKTVIPLTLASNGFQVTSKNGFWIDLKLRQ